MKRQFIIWVLMVSGVFIFGDLTDGSADDVMIIANQSVLQENLEPDVVKNIFLGKIIKWENGDRISVVMYQNSEIHNKFLKKYIRRTAFQFENVWRRNVFTGKGQIPIRRKSPEEILAYVSKKKGTVGYISSDVKLPADVKVLAK